jgi:hypothetical protein
MMSESEMTPVRKMKRQEAQMNLFFKADYFRMFDYARSKEPV